VVIIPQEELAKSGYKPDMNYENYNHLSISLATHSKLNIEIWRLVFLPLSLLAIENLQIHFIFEF
jgi:hypothetical protein